MRSPARPLSPAAGPSAIAAPPTRPPPPSTPPQLAKDKKKLDASMPAESRDMIRMRNQMRFELTSVEDELKDLCKTAAADDKSNGKVSREEIAARKEVLETVKDEYYKVFEEVRGACSVRAARHLTPRAAPPTLFPGPLLATPPAPPAPQITGTRHSGNKSSEQGGLGMSTLTKESLIAGTFAGAGMKMDREALSGENQQQLELIRNEVQDQDNILDEISKGLDDLKDAAERIGDVRVPAARLARPRREIAPDGVRHPL